MSKKPPTQDNSRNEYIPAYITKAPFYAEGLSDGDYLEHQRLHATPKDTLDKAKWYERGRKTGPAATKFRKGACENCGAISHKTKECLERPRKHGAKWTGRDIRADEVVADVKLGWDAKRDRWNGYDSREYTAVVQEFEDMEKLRQSAASASNAQKKLTENGEGEDDDDEDGTNTNGNGNDKSEAKYAEETDMGRSQSTSTRQLRLREDTAKYLVNLDLDSARYDPKTRSMDTTTQDLSHDAGDSVADDGFVRPSDASDDAAAFERAQKYAWETQELQQNNNSQVSSSAQSQNAAKLHLQANPTEGEYLLKRRTEETNTKKAALRKALIDKYGDQGHLSTLLDTETPSTTKPLLSSSSSKTTTMAPPQKRKAIPSSESYIEYDKHGNPKPNPTNTSNNKSKTTIAKSKYPEDILTNNHTSVFGSWWRSNDFSWGYACCHSTVRNSYCTGDAGREAFLEAEGLSIGRGLSILNNSDNNNDNDDDDKGDKGDRVDPSQKNGGGNSQIDDGGVVVDDLDSHRTSSLTMEASKKKKVLHKRQFRDDDAAMDAEMEAYKRTKLAADDPMRAMGELDDDGLLKTS